MTTARRSCTESGQPSAKCVRTVRLSGQGSDQQIWTGQL
jgi:hypothetical protein